jgi:Rod binding domain-containing protein
MSTVPALSPNTPPLLPRAGATPSDLASQQHDFASMLARGNASVGAGASKAERLAAARKGAEEFVSMTLVQPLLKQLRETSQAAAPFAPSSAELQFRSMLDAQMSLRLVKASNFPLVDVVARNIARKGEAAKPAAQDTHA